METKLNFCSVVYFNMEVHVDWFFLPLSVFKNLPFKELHFMPLLY